MSIFEPAPPRWTSRMLSVLRIVAGLVYMTAGTMKLFGFPPMPHGMPPIGAGAWSLDAMIARSRTRGQP
jgi:putative oxidoreductase